MKPNSAVPAALLLPALLLPALLTAGARGAAAQEAAQDAAPPIAVGRLALPPCVPDSGGYGGYCGALPVRLDRHGPGSDARTLSVGFEFYPHTGPGGSAGLILAQEGGPGCSTTGSRSGRRAWRRDGNGAVTEIHRTR